MDKSSGDFTGDYKLRYERLDEWVYPGQLTQREMRELHDRGEYHYMMGEALAKIAGKRPANPEAEFLAGLYEGLVEFPWVGRYRVVRDFTGYSYTIIVQTIGNIILSYRVSTQVMLNSHLNIGKETGRYFWRLLYDYVRKEFPIPDEWKESR